MAEQLEERNEMSETPLIREAADGDARHVEWLLEAGADVNAKMNNEIGFFALNQAAYFGNASCIQQLLKFKADPKALALSKCRNAFKKKEQKQKALDEYDKEQRGDAPPPPVAAKSSRWW